MRFLFCVFHFPLHCVLSQIGFQSITHHISSDIGAGQIAVISFICFLIVMHSSSSEATTFEFHTKSTTWEQGTYSVQISYPNSDAPFAGKVQIFQIYICNFIVLFSISIFSHSTKTFPGHSTMPVNDKPVIGIFYTNCGYHLRVLSPLHLHVRRPGSAFPLHLGSTGFRRCAESVRHTVQIFFRPHHLHFSKGV